MWNLIKQFLISSIEANKEVIKHCKKNQDYINFMLERKHTDLHYAITEEKLREDNNFTKLGYYVVSKQNVEKYIKQ